MALPDFEGLPVTAVAITIPNAGGGFRDPLEIEPVVLHQGDEVYATFKLRVRQINHKPVDKDEPGGAQQRIQVLDALSATFAVDEERAAADLEEQAERIRLAKEGPSLFDGGDEAAGLASEHDAGEHRELVDGCPECDHEAELVEAGE